MARLKKEDHARILHLVDVERRAVREIAAEFGCTAATIYGLLAKLRRGAGEKGEAEAVAEEGEAAAGATLSAQPGLGLESQPAAPQPAASQPDTPAASHSVIIPFEPMADKPVTAKRAIVPERQSAAPRPAAPQPAAPRPAAPQPTALQPATPEPVASEPIARRSAPMAERRPALGARLSKPGMGLVMRTEDGEETMTPFRSIDDLLSAIKPVLRATARNPDPGAGGGCRGAMTDPAARLRRLAIAQAFPALGKLGAVVESMGFVQADPIRAPARAQDLILRQRVTNYRPGDLGRRFNRLGLEEDFFYAYGFMPREVMQLLHPRPDAENPESDYRPSGLAAEVLALVSARRETHPRDLEAAFGRDRAVNAWGGFSKETTQVLHRLHYHGLLRVVRRQDGIRVYGMAAPPPGPLPAEERRRRLLLLLLGLFAPVSRPSLTGLLALPKP
ncbi:hypothetical protein Dimus_023637 [Dionaea muscipula]